MWDEIKRPATAIAIALAVLSTVAGILVSLYFYHKGERHAEIAFKVEQVQVFDKTHIGAAPITVRDEAGKTIDDNIYAASIIIWNNGNTEIKKEEVREPYHLVLKSDTAKILDISPIFFSRNNVNGFAVNRKTGELSWQHFDESEGLKMRMIYVDHTMNKIDLAGYAVKTTVLDIQKLEKPHYTYEGHITYTPFYVMISVMVIMTMLIVYLVLINPRMRPYWWMPLLGLILGVLCGGLAIMLYSPPAAPTPPPGFLSAQNQ
jgi:hypothetical protein